MEATLARSSLPVLAAFAAAMAFMAVPALAASESGPREARGRIDFAIVIPVALRVVPVSEPRSLAIRAADVARGYVDVDAATALRVTSNNAAGFVAVIACDPALVTRVEARIAGQRIEAGAPGSSAHVEGGKMIDAPLGVDYRLFLAPGAAPGTYRWPVALRLAPGA